MAMQELGKTYAGDKYVKRAALTEPRLYLSKGTACSTCGSTGDTYGQLRPHAEAVLLHPFKSFKASVFFPLFSGVHNSMNSRRGVK